MRRHASSISLQRPLCMALYLALSLAGGSSLAQSKQDGCLKDVTCRNLYYKALKEYDEGRYVEALAGFQSAYSRRQMPWLLLNIGRSLQRLGRPQEAISNYERYLKAEPNIDEPTREKVNKYIEQTKALLDSPTPTPTQPSPEPQTVTPPVPTPTASMSVPLAVEQKTPVYKKWWFWTIIGAGVAVGVGAGVGIAVGSRKAPPTPFLGTDPIYMPSF